METFQLCAILLAAAAVTWPALLGLASSALRETPTPSVAPPTPTTGAAGPSVGARPATLPEVRTPVPPTRIVVPGIDAELPVVPTAVRADGAMEIPDDPRTAGWYRFGPDPTSDSGAMVVAAHIDSREAC